MSASQRIHTKFVWKLSTLYATNGSCFISFWCAWRKRLLYLIIFFTYMHWSRSSFCICTVENHVFLMNKYYTTYTLELGFLFDLEILFRTMCIIMIWMRMLVPNKIAIIVPITIDFLHSYQITTQLHSASIPSDKISKKRIDFVIIFQSNHYSLLISFW